MRSCLNGAHYKATFREGQKRASVAYAQAIRPGDDFEKQQALAEAMISPLYLAEMPNREDLETVLARLQVPLSEEILATRGEG